MVGFEDFKGLSEAELYKALVNLANTRTNAFGFTEAGQQIYDLAEGLKFKILTKEDIVGSEDKDGMLNDFAEEVKDDGISPEIINTILTDKFHVGQKYVTEQTEHDGLKGKYVKDDAVQDWEGYLMKSEVEVKPEVKEDFTEKVLMSKVQEQIDVLDAKYPELLGKDKAIDDAIEVKEEIEKEIKELKELSGKLKEDGVNEDINDKDVENYVNTLLEDLEKTDDFVNDPSLKDFKTIKEKLRVMLQRVFGDHINRGI